MCAFLVLEQTIWLSIKAVREAVAAVSRSTPALPHAKLRGSRIVVG
jgi:hypothetical protein